MNHQNANAAPENLGITTLSGQMNERLGEILSRFSKARIGVVGDYCLDAYWILHEGERELSVETGKPTHAVVRQRYSLGGAANIAANLAAMEAGHIQAFAVVGANMFGREMLNQLQGLGVDCRGVVVQREDWDTSVYAKPYWGDAELERMDFGRFNEMTDETESRLMANLEQAVPGLDVLIVNQQLPKGIHSERMVACLTRLAAETPACCFVADSRHFPLRFRGMILKLNACEAAMCCGRKRTFNYAVPVSDLRNYAALIFEETRKPVVITRGARGILIYDGAKAQCIPGIQILEKKDPVGAGDTISATLGACLAAGATLEEAAVIANAAASITVRKLKQTGTASREEIVTVGTDTDYVFNPELSEDPRGARYLSGSHIEVISDDLALGLMRHALFDHDGTISTLREGWETVMEPVMIRSILGDLLSEATEDDYQRVVARVRHYIDQSTGIQTILQMQALVEMVKEFGFVPRERILGAPGYKKIYNDALMERINWRRQRLKDGELDVSDYTVKGAVDFLLELRRREVKLYLASGTDEEDVRTEAKLLGYADLFEGRIFGAVGDVANCSKKMVIDRIIQESGLSGPQLVTFGDGPVELRETKKRGGIAVGVASDEVRRFGLSVEKRARLIRAGADLIVPDYSQRRLLLAHLFQERAGHGII